MARRRGRSLALVAAAIVPLLGVAGLVGALAGLGACEAILGEHTVYGQDALCSSDEDCHSGERCDPDGERCRKKCDDEADAGSECGLYRPCGYNDTCAEPVGSPCDAEEIADEWCGAAECTDKNVEGDTVPGYCTISCSDYSNDWEPLPQCPDGFACKDGYCLCGEYPDCLEQ